MGLITAANVINTKINAETFVSGEDDLTFDSPIMVAQTIAIGATVQAIANIDFVAAKLQYLYILSTQNITLTFTLGTGTLVVALIAGVPWYWSRTYVSTIPNPFAYDSVSCLAANASGVAATLTIRGGVVA